jgi:hypothetical protein
VRAALAEIVEPPRRKIEMREAPELAVAIGGQEETLAVAIEGEVARRDGAREPRAFAWKHALLPEEHEHVRRLRPPQPLAHGLREMRDLHERAERPVDFVQLRRVVRASRDDQLAPDRMPAHGERRLELRVGLDPGRERRGNRRNADRLEIGVRRNHVVGRRTRCGREREQERHAMDATRHRSIFGERDW